MKEIFKCSWINTLRRGGIMFDVVWHADLPNLISVHERFSVPLSSTQRLAARVLLIACCNARERDPCRLCGIKYKLATLLPPFFVANQPSASGHWTEVSSSSDAGKRQKKMKFTHLHADLFPNVMSMVRIRIKACLLLVKLIFRGYLHTFTQLAQKLTKAIVRFVTWVTYFPFSAPGAAAINFMMDVFITFSSSSRSI